MDRVQLISQYRALQAELVRRAPNSIWAFANLLKNEKKQPFDPTRFPYMRQPLEDFSPLMAIQKATQTSATFHMQVKELWLAGHKPLTIVHTMPTIEDVQDYSGGRFKPMVSSHPYVKGLLSGEVDKVGQKLFKSGGQVYFRGTNAERATISIPGDVLNTDEYDRQNPEARDELRRRLDASPLAWEWVYSTPTLPGYGIGRIYAESDQHVWTVKCEGCGRDNMLDGEYYYRGIKERRSSSTDGGKELYWSCMYCDHELNRRAGLWVPLYPGKLVRGYLIPQVIVPHITPAKLRLEEQQTRRPEKFRRNNLAIATAAGKQTLNRELLQQRAVLGDEWQTAVAPTDPGGPAYPITMGVDQGDLLHVSISAYRDGRRHVIRRLIVNEFEEVGKLIQQYGAWVIVVDGNPNKKSAEALARAFPGRVFLAFYYDDRRGDGAQEKAGQEPWTVLLERTSSLDASADSWQVGDSLTTMPADTPLWEEWLAQMCAMQRDTEEGKDGRPRAVWRKTGADHFRHADNYDQEALRLLLAPPAEQTVEDDTRVKISEY